MIKGSIVALVTPFDSENNIDFTELTRLLDLHLANNTDGLLLLGTTAEAESLSDEEKYDLVKYVIDYVEDQLKIMVGIIANTPKEAIRLANLFNDLDFDSYLVSAPYYIKTNTEGLIKHFNYIADNVQKPIVLYNVPRRTGINIDYEVVRILSYHPNIVGIKEASGDLVYQAKVASICNEKFILYGADDLTMLGSLALGAGGIISVIGNAFPKETKLIIDLFFKDVNIARTTYFKLLTLIEDIFKETSPIPVKYLMYLQGYKTNHVRLPLAIASIGLRRKLEEDYLSIVYED